MVVGLFAESGVQIETSHAFAESLRDLGGRDVERFTGIRSRKDRSIIVCISGIVLDILDRGQYVFEGPFDLLLAQQGSWVIESCGDLRQRQGQI